MNRRGSPPSRHVSPVSPTRSSPCRRSARTSSPTCVAPCPAGRSTRCAIRVSRHRAGAPAPLTTREHLVLLVDGPADRLTAEAFAEDPGKGLLAVRTAGILVVAVHLSTDRWQTRQLARLAELA